MPVILDRLSNLSLHDAWRIGFENAEAAYSDRAKDRIKECRESFERLLASGSAGFVYGSTAAPGARAKVPLSPDQQERLAETQNLFAPKAFGGGNKWVPKHAVRLVLLARAASYIEGHGRIRLETAEWVVGLLSRPVPDMPLDTATGPGEVMPLSWLYPRISEVDLAPGEIMALYNGSPCAAGLATDAALTAARRLGLCERVFALAIEAVAAPLDAYDLALLEITKDPHQCGVISRLNEFLAGVPLSERLPHQAPVSWRVMPTVLGTAARAVHDAEEITLQSLQSVAHNPIYLPPDPDHADGRAISPGGFHNHQASRAIDVLNAAGADICALAAKLTARLLDGEPFGLPKLLVPEDSGVIGTEFLAWSQTSHAERARLASAPAVLTIGLEDPGGGQSDVAAPVFLAFERHLEAWDAVDATLATLALAIVQSFRLTGRPPPPRLKEFHGVIDEIVAPFELTAIAELGQSLRNVKIAMSNAVVGRGPLAPLIQSPWFVG